MAAAFFSFHYLRSFAKFGSFQMARRIVTMMPKLGKKSATDEGRLVSGGWMRVSSLRGDSRRVTVLR